MTKEIHQPVWMEQPATQAVMNAFIDAKVDARFVGGAVRDTLLKRTVHDIDLATPSLPSETIKIIEAAGLKAVATGIDHGTITAVSEGKGYEITTLRKDMASDGRHAKVEYTDDWKRDASRRDFTMNAMYLSFNGILTDFFDGQQDALAGNIRFIGDANTRIEEDALRILRFFRFFAHYGKAPIDAEGLMACKTHATMIENLSGERIQHEMLRLLGAKDPIFTLRAMQQHTLLDALLPTLSLDPCQSLMRVEREATIRPSALIRLACLLRHTERAEHEALDAIKQRWKMSNAHYKTLQTLILPPLTIPHEMMVREQKKAIRRMGAEDFSASVLISWAEHLEANPELNTRSFKQMLSLAREWQSPEFPLTGADIKSLGVKQGERLGELLHKAEAYWEEKEYSPDKEELLEWLKLHSSSPLEGEQTKQGERK